MAGRSPRNVKKRPGAKLMDRAVLDRSGGTPRKHKPDVLDIAARRAYAGPDVHRPFPSRLVGGPADGQTPDANEFKFSFFERSQFVGSFKTLQDCFECRHT